MCDDLESAVRWEGCARTFSDNIIGPDDNDDIAIESGGGWASDDYATASLLRKVTIFTLP